MKTKRYTFFAFVALAGVLACSKQNNSVANCNEIKFATSYVTPDTKGTAFDSKSSLSTFTVSAFNNDADASDDHTRIMDNVVVTNNSGKWTYEDICRWSEPLGKLFFAWANKPADGIASVVATYQQQTLTYTAVPANAADQKDILLGYYAGDGGDSRIATISFKHPLTALEFKIGEIIGLSKITKISIDGIYKTGSVTQNADGSFAAWSASGSQTVYQTVSGDLPAKGSTVGVPFILIPQSAAKFSVTIEGVDNASSAVTLLGEIAASGGNKWEAGKKTVCTISVDPSRELDCNLTAYTADAGDDIFLK